MVVDKCAKVADIYARTCGPIEDIEDAIRSLSPAEALEAHDARVRDEALVEAAKAVCSKCRKGEGPTLTSGYYIHSDYRVCSGYKIYRLRGAK